MEKRWIAVVGIALLLLVLLSVLFPDFFSRIQESPEPVLPITELPEPFTMLHDVNEINKKNPALFSEILSHFTVLSGSYGMEGDNSFARDLRARGILYAYRLASYNGKDENGWLVWYTTAEEMYADFRSPFSTNEGDIGYGIEYGYDAIEIDEVVPDFCDGSRDGNGELRGQMFVDALAMLREEFPEKIILVWGTEGVILANPTLDCSTVLNGIADYADVFLLETYISEHQRLSLDDPDRYFAGSTVDPFTYFNSVYTNLLNYPDLISKTVYGLYIPQRPVFYVDNSFTINLGAHMDDQACIIRNNFPKTLKGISNWGYNVVMAKEDYSYLINSLFTISDHYYLSDLTSCLSDPNDLINVDIDGSFEQKDWIANGQVTFEEYSGLSSFDLLKNPMDSTRGGYRDSDYRPPNFNYNSGPIWAGYIDLGTTFAKFGNEIPPLVAQEENEISQTVSLDAGSYFLHGYVYTQTRGLPLDIRIYNHDDLLLEYSYPILVYPEHRWDSFELYFVVPPDASEITLVFSTSTNDLVYLDYLQVEPIFYELEGFCGEGYGACDCGEMLMTDYVLSEEDPVTQEPCSSDGLIIGNSGISLDCDGHELVGDGNKKGIVINSKSDITIQNCIVDGFYTNVYADFASDITIKNSILKNSGNDGIGLYMINSKGFNVEDNLLENNDDVLRTWFDGGGHTISRNVIRNNRGQGIFLYTSSHNSTITFNEITDNARGSIYVGGEGSRVEQNKIRNSGDTGIYVSGDGAYILGNVIGGGERDGISVSGDGGIIESNTLSGINGVGIGVNMLATDNLVLNNIIIDSEYGIDIEEETDGVELTGNKVVDVARNGFKISSVNGLTMNNNIVEGCGGDGIIIMGSSRNGKIVNNVVNECDDGFNINDGHGLSFSENTAKDNRNNGFWLVSSDSTSLVANKALDNLGHGFQIATISDVRLENNEASRNDYDGFNLGDINLLFVINNNAYSNRDGFHFEGISSSDITNNVAQFNENNGFYFWDSTNINLESNVANFNSNGFELESTISSLVRNTGCNNNYDFICFGNPEPVSGSLNRFDTLVEVCLGGWPVYGENYLYCTDCEDGTLNNQCSTKQPSYCSEGTLINDCQQCGCPNGKACSGRGECVLKKTTQKSSRN